MKRYIPTLPVLAAALCLWGPLARAADLVLQSAPGAQERAVVDSIYGAFEKSAPNMVVQTGMVDLEGRGVASVVARFVSKGTCASDGIHCETVVLRYGPSGWQPVFTHTAATLGTDTASAAHGMTGLVVDGAERWVWGGYGGYLPDVSSMGQVFPTPVAADSYAAQAAQAAVAADKDMSVFLRAPVTAARQISLSLGGVQAAMVDLYGPGDCVAALGCPNALMVHQSAGWTPLWTGFATAVGAVLPSVHNGLHDVALEGASGYAVLAFDGARYRLLRTSYPSSTTPAP